MSNPWDNNSGSGGGCAITTGIGFNGALFLTFLVLKLTHVIDWSWLWITAPLWIPIAISILIIIVLVLVLRQYDLQ